MSRRASTLLLVAAAAAASLGAACNDPRLAAEDGVLVVSQEQQASWTRNFNPLLPPGTARWPSAGGIYEPLLVYNTATGAYVPWLATAYAWSDDARTLRFTLRPGVVWSDGAPFTARDVVFTFELLRRFPALDLEAIWLYLAGVRAVDDLTVELDFARPHVPGLYPIAKQAIVPEHLWRDVPDPVAFANPNPVGTGPFTEVEVFRQQLYQLGRNPRYWQPGKPAVRALRFPAFPSNDQANLALLHGEVDWAGNFVPAIDRIFVGRDPEHHGYWFPLDAGTIMLYANTARPPFDDVRLRKAMSLAIDRERLVTVALYGHTRPADTTGLSDAYARWRAPAGLPADAWTAHDPARAAALLDEAGYTRGPGGLRRAPDGTPLSFQLEVVIGWSDWVRAAQLVARDLAPLGIRVTVKTYDFGAWFDRLRRGEYTLSLGWTVESPTPFAFYQALLSPRTVRPLGEAAAQNWHRFGSARAERLLAAFEVTTDEAEQRRLAGELAAEFAATAPAIPLFPAPSWGAYSTRRFTGFPSAANPYARLSPNHLPECLLTLTEVQPR